MFYFLSEFLKDLWGPFRLLQSHMVMMGGGASVVSRHIRPSDGLCRTVTLLDDRVNAQGYERAVAALWGDDVQG